MLFHFYRGMELLQQGAAARAADHLATARGLADGVDLRPWSSVLALPLEVVPGWHALALRQLGRDDHADREIAACAALIGSEHHSVDAYAHGVASIDAALRDRPDDAAPHAARSVSLGESGGLDAVIGHQRVISAWARGRQGHPGALDEALDAIRVLDPIPAVLMRPLLLGLTADLALPAGLDLDGDPPGTGPEGARLARDLLDRAVTEAETTGNRFGLPRLHELRARAHDHLDNPSAAAADREHAATAAAQQRGHAPTRPPSVASPPTSAQPASSADPVG